VTKVCRKGHIRDAHIKGCPVCKRARLKAWKLVNPAQVARTLQQREMMRADGRQEKGRHDDGPVD
jgi:hypothetical protein